MERFIPVSILGLFAICSFCCLPPRLHSRDAVHDAQNDGFEMTADVDINVPDSGLDIVNVPDGSGVDLSLVDTSDFHSDAETEIESGTDADLASADGESPDLVDVALDVDPACGERASCPSGFTCKDQGQGPRCYCDSPTCASCETGPTARDCILGEYCSTNDRCTCGEIVSTVVPTTVDRCSAGAFQCGTTSSACESGYQCKAGSCGCKFAVGTTGFCWQSPEPFGWNINAVYHVGQNDILAVANRGTILRFDGSTWTSAVVDGQDDLRDIDGASDGTIVIVGASGTVLQQAVTGWQPIGPTAALDFVAVRVFSKDEIFVAAKDGTIMRRKQGQWSISRLASNGEALSDIDGTSPSHVLAVGSKNGDKEPLLLQFDGAIWDEVSTNLSAGWPFRHVWVPSPQISYATSLTGLFKGVSDVWGSEIENLPGPPGHDIVSGMDIDALWLTSGASTWLFNWDGETWNLADAQIHQTPAITALHADNGVALVGGRYGYLSTYESGLWQPLAANIPADAPIVRFSRTPTDDIFGVRGNELIRYVDGEWKEELTLPIGTNLRYVWAASPTSLFMLTSSALNFDTNTHQQIVVQYGGSGIPVETVAEWDAGGRPKCTPEYIAVHGSSDTNVMLVGKNGVIGADGTCGALVARLDQGEWVPSTPTDISFFWAVHVFNETSAIAAGPDVVARLNGDVWAVESGLVVPVNAIWAGSPSNILLVGDNGVIQHYDGFKWETMESKTTSKLYAVWAFSDSDIFVLGEGVLLHFNGLEWTSMPLEIESGRYRDIVGRGSTDLWLGGDGHAILHQYRK